MYAPSSRARLLRRNPGLAPAALACRPAAALRPAAQASTTVGQAMADAALPVLLLGAAGLVVGGVWGYRFVRATWGRA